jgi:hypothetical protein
MLGVKSLLCPNVCKVLSDRLKIVKKGRIFNFVSGDRRFEIIDWIILEIINSIIEEPTLENQPLTRKISKWFLIHARFCMK